MDIKENKNFMILKFLCDEMFLNTKEDCFLALHRISKGSGLIIMERAIPNKESVNRHKKTGLFYPIPDWRNVNI